MSTTPLGQVPMRDLSLDDRETLADHSPASSALGEKHNDEDATLAEGTAGGKGVATSDRADGRILLKEVECYEKLGFCYPQYKKWIILSVIFAIQVSMYVEDCSGAGGAWGAGAERQPSTGTSTHRYVRPPHQFLPPRDGADSPNPVLADFRWKRRSSAGGRVLDLRPESSSWSGCILDCLRVWKRAVGSLVRR